MKRENKTQSKDNMEPAMDHMQEAAFKKKSFELTDDSFAIRRMTRIVSPM